MKKEKLTKIERVRLSSTLAENLGKLKPYGIKKSKFIRQAIEEKIERDLPKLNAEKRRLANLTKYPF
jgi:predicted DNA-binding protein